MKKILLLLTLLLSLTTHNVLLANKTRDKSLSATTDDVSTTAKNPLVCNISIPPIINLN